MLVFATSSTTKKFLIFLAVMILLVVVLLGLISSSIKSAAERKAKEIDLYLTDMCRFQIIRTPNQVVTYVTKHETNQFFLKNRWFLRVFVVVAALFIYFMSTKFSNDYGTCLQYIDQLWYKFTWPTATFFGIKNFPVDWPTVSSTPTVHLSFAEDGGLGWLTYITFAVTVVTLIAVAVNAINLAARIKRANKIKVDVFGKSVEYGEKNNF